MANYLPSQFYEDVRMEGELDTIITGMIIYIIYSQMDDPRSIN
jgi:hypothetical protein